MLGQIDLDFNLDFILRIKEKKDYDLLFLKKTNEDIIEITQTDFETIINDIFSDKTLINNNSIKDLVNATCDFFKNDTLDISSFRIEFLDETDNCCDYKINFPISRLIIPDNIINIIDSQPIPDKFDEIQESLNLEKIYISKNVKSIPIGLLDSYKLKEINVDQDNINFYSDNGILYNKDMTVLVKYPAAFENDFYYVIPDTIKTIGEKAFAYSSDFCSIELPKNLDTIERKAFYRSQISYLELPDTLKKIENNAFQFSNIVELDLPDSLEYIGDKAFFATSHLSSLFIPKDVSFIGKQAFSSFSYEKPVAVDENNKYYKDNNGFLEQKKIDDIIKINTHNNIVYESKLLANQCH